MFDNLGNNQNSNQGVQGGNQGNVPTPPKKIPQSGNTSTSDVTPPSKPRANPVPPNIPTIPQSDARKKAEDIFADTDKPKAFQPKQNSIQSNLPSKEEFEDAKKDSKRLVFLIFILLCAIIVIALGVFSFSSILKNSKSSIDIDEIDKTKFPDIATEEPITDDEPEKIIEEDVVKDEKKAEEATVEDAKTEEPLDTDKDGLSDMEEKELGTNINKVDTDNDNLFDLEEVKVYKTDPIDPDTDDDGVLDGTEVKDGSNPNGEGMLYDIGDIAGNENNEVVEQGDAVNQNNDMDIQEDKNKDTDNDGLLDIEEYEYKTNPQKEDTDNDGLFDGDEVNIYKSDPLNEDTDGDGYSDGAEVDAGYNPAGAGTLQEAREYEEKKDDDEDGLPNIKEIELGTDLNIKDTDRDGLSDGEEVNVYHTDPLNKDSDGDTFLDGAEVKNGYNPNGDGELK